MIRNFVYCHDLSLRSGDDSDVGCETNSTLLVET